MAFPIAAVIGRGLATAAPTLLKQVGARVGAAASPSAIMSAIKGNKLLTAMVAWDVLGPTASEVLNFIDENPEVRSALQAMQNTNWQPEYQLDNLPTLKDEFDLIEDVSRSLGGYDNLIALRNALKIQDEVHTRYQEIRSLGFKR